MRQTYFPPIALTFYRIIFFHHISLLIQNGHDHFRHQHVVRGVDAYEPLLPLDAMDHRRMEPIRERPIVGALDRPFRKLGIDRLSRAPCRAYAAASLNRLWWFFCPLLNLRLLKSGFPLTYVFPSGITRKTTSPILPLIPRTSTLF